MVGKGDLVQESLRHYAESITNQGALVVKSGKHTGRSPQAKFIVKDEQTENTVDWEANQSMSSQEWDLLEDSAHEHVTIWKRRGKTFYEIYAAAGKKTYWETRTRKIFKFVCENPVQVLFIQNMFEEINKKDLKEGSIEGTVYCLPRMSQSPTVGINFTKNCIIICGTSYLGEIKKSVFTYMNYVMTDVDVLPMHCSVNVDKKMKNPSVFFGLSGTGKTTLSSSPDRILLGDDEHGWASGVLFNIESGCYAKTIDLCVEKEPEIFNAANKFGSILENVVCVSGEPDYFDTSLSKNGRASYPLAHLGNYVERGCVFEDPVNIVMLTCDAFGVLPAISKLSHEQAREMFLIGYTSKVAGTEVGVEEPVATFSSCFGAPFLPRKPQVYADLLEEYVVSRDINCWLVNTGWSGGSYGVGSRMSLNLTRTIIKSIVSGAMSHQAYFTHEPTGLSIPRIIPTLTGFDTRPESTWKSKTEYKKAAKSLMKEIHAQILRFK